MSFDRLSDETVKKMENYYLNWEHGKYLGELVQPVDILMRSLYEIAIKSEKDKS